jgi:hypothetical protein
VVTGLSALALWAVLASPASAAPDPVQGAFAGESFPWYHARAGRVRPVLPRPDWHAGWLGSVGDWFERVGKWVSGWFRGMNRWRVPGVAGMGDLVAIGLAMLFLTLVLVGLLELLRRYRPLAAEAGVQAVSVGRGSARRVEGLPLGSEIDLSDPWGAARRLRDRGDYAAAVVHLFAHQVLTLDRLGQIRIVPGRTGRQLVRSVADRSLRERVEPTLRLFEAVYYGHRAPSAEAFETVWVHALAFEDQVSAGVAS